MSVETTKPAFFPATAAGALLLVLAVLADPCFVRMAVPLQWHIGDITLFLRGTQALLVALAALFFLDRRRVSVPIGPVFLGRSMAAIGIWILVAEILLRLLGLPFEERETPLETAYGRFDAELGWSHIPDTTVRENFGREEREITMHFDSIGARSGLKSKERIPGAPTVLLVGGSFTMGHAVNHEETLSGHLEAMKELPWQVVNLGVEGFGTDQSLLQMKRHLASFNTKAVVYTFICPHVLRNAVPERRLLYPKGRFLGTKPLFALAGDGTLFLERTPVEYQEMEYARTAAALRLLWTSYGPVPDMKLTRALVSEMRDVAEEAGAGFVLVNWDVPGLSGSCGDSPFEGMDLLTVNTLDYGSEDWAAWTVPGDGHPDTRAYGHMARLILEKFREEGILAQ